MVAIYEKRRRKIGSDILNFILQMASKEDRQDYLDVQKAQVRISREQLGISQAVESRAAKTFAAGKPIRKLAGVEAKGRKRLVKRFGRADQALDTAKREYDVAKTTGDLARQAETARTLSAVKALHGKSAEMFETILFADEIAKDSRAQLYLAQHGALAANQTVEMLRMQMVQNKARGDARLQGVTDMVKATGGTGGPALVDNIDRILDPSQSIADITADLQSQISAAKGEAAGAARQGDWIDPADFTKTEKEKFDPWSLAQYSDAYRNTGRGVETMTIARPKDQRRFWWRDNNEMTLTRKRAVEIGAGDLYDAAKGKEATKGETKEKKSFPGASAGMTYPYTPKRKTVKELADEKAKKVKPTKGKTTKKSPYPDYPDAFLEDGVWKVIRDGKKYKVVD